MKTARCRTCGAEIVWARMPSGKLSPFDAEPSPDLRRGHGARGQRPLEPPMSGRRPPGLRVLRLGLDELESLLRGSKVDQPMASWDEVVRATSRILTSEANGFLLEELELAARVRANGGDPWKPAPTLGTLVRLARLNVQAALRKAEEG